MATLQMMPLFTQSTYRGAYREVIEPSHVFTTFVADNIDNHDFRARAIGKGRLSVVVDNLANQNLVVSLYGAQLEASEIGAGDVKYIGQFTVTAANGANDGYDTNNDPFPFYIVRAAYALLPTDVPLKTITIYVNLMSA